jgi:capsid protein
VSPPLTWRHRGRCTAQATVATLPIARATTAAMAVKAEASEPALRAPFSGSQMRFEGLTMDDNQRASKRVAEAGATPNFRVQASVTLPLHSTLPRPTCLHYVKTKNLHCCRAARCVARYLVLKRLIPSKQKASGPPLDVE